MKSFLLGCALAVLGLLAGTPADAQSAAPRQELTRAQVAAELSRARAAGELDFRLAPVLDEPGVPRRARPAGQAAAPAAGREAHAPAPGAGPDTERLAATR